MIWLVSPYWLHLINVEMVDLLHMFLDVVCKSVYGTCALAALRTSEDSEPVTMSWEIQPSCRSEVVFSHKRDFDVYIRPRLIMLPFFLVLASSDPPLMESRLTACPCYKIKTAKLEANVGWNRQPSVPPLWCLLVLQKLQQCIYAIISK